MPITWKKWSYFSFKKQKYKAQSSILKTLGIQRTFDTLNRSSASYTRKTCEFIQTFNVYKPNSRYNYCQMASFLMWAGEPWRENIDSLRWNKVSFSWKTQQQLNGYVFSKWVLFLQSSAKHFICNYRGQTLSIVCCIYQFNFETEPVLFQI